MKASLKAVVLRRLRRSTSAAFIAGAPVNTVAPAVTGTTTEGSTLSTTDGTWTGTPTISFTYQWFDALLDGSGNVLTDSNGDPLGSPVSSATANTYVLPITGGRLFGQTLLLHCHRDERSRRRVEGQQRHYDPRSPYGRHGFQSFHKEGLVHD
jgi:hypothetical protein